MPYIGAQNVLRILYQFLRQPYRVRLFALDVRLYCAFRIRNHDIDIYGSCLTITPAPPDRLIICLEGIRKSDENFTVTVLPIHPKSKHRWLTDEYFSFSGPPSSLIFHFQVIRRSASDGERFFSEFTFQFVLFRIQVAPQDARRILSYCDFSGFRSSYSMLSRLAFRRSISDMDTCGRNPI